MRSRSESQEGRAAAVAMLERQDALDRLEVLETEAYKDRRKAIGWWLGVGCALGLTLVQVQWVLVAGYPLWALWHLRDRAAMRRRKIEGLRKEVGR